MRKIMLMVLAAMMICLLQAAPVLASEIDVGAELKYDKDFTISELANSNGLSVSEIISRLKIDESDASLTIDNVSKRYSELNPEIIKEKTKKLLIEQEIESHKNWKLIMLKFFLWVLLVLSLAAIMNRSKKIFMKPVLLVVSAIVFGVLLGSDPNPLGTVKDGIVLYANDGVLFKPRFVALAFLLLLALVFGRMFCGWGCQIGVIQDLFYRFRDKKIKVPFWFSNSIRILVFSAMIASAFLFHIDILGYVDPFKVYNLSLVDLNLGFIILLLILSFFIYRPWCSFACPFGLIAWGIGKISYLKLHVNNDTCSDCGSCSRICPTGAAAGRRNGENSAECYLCDRCREVCPNKSITYGR